VIGIIWQMPYPVDQSRAISVSVDVPNVPRAVIQKDASVSKKSRDVVVGE